MKKIIYFIFILPILIMPLFAFGQTKLFQLPELPEQPEYKLLPWKPVKEVQSFIHMNPTVPELVSPRNKYFEKIKELEDARQLYVESGKLLPDGFLTIHTAPNGWRIHFLRRPAISHVSKTPQKPRILMPPGPAYDFLRQIQPGPAASPSIIPTPSTSGLGETPRQSITDAFNTRFSGGVTFYGEVSPYKTYATDIMFPYWIDGAAGFVFNFNALENPKITLDGQKGGTVSIGLPGSDLAIAFETQKKGPLNIPYTYILFYKITRIKEGLIYKLIKQKISYEEFMAYGEKMKYWEEQKLLFGQSRWIFNEESEWQER